MLANSPRWLKKRKSIGTKVECAEIISLCNIPDYLDTTNPKRLDLLFGVKSKNNKLEQLLLEKAAS